MKKLYIIVAAVFVLGLGAVLAAPVMAASTWKTDTTVEVTDMLTELTNNMEASSSFLSKAEPTTADYAAEIERTKASSAVTEKTVEAIDDLGPNTIDLTGQYASAEELRDSMMQTMTSMVDKYNQQTTILQDEEKTGATVESTSKYANISSKLSTDYAELERLIGQL